MAQLAEQLPRRATYADLEAVPPHMVAELIRGTLHTFPRPAPPHTHASSRLGGELMGPFGIGRGGPGGWWILDEPQIKFPDPTAAGEVESVVPDLAGWRRERLPELPKEAHFTLAPDWICEILSPSTAAYDRAEKMPLYARERVLDAWFIDPIGKTLEVFRLASEGGLWTLLAIHQGAVRVHAEPFEAFELDLALLWAGP